VNSLNRIAEKVEESDEGDIWLSEEQQRRLLRRMYRDVRALFQVREQLRQYMLDIFERLNEPLP